MIMKEFSNYQIVSKKTGEEVRVWAFKDLAAVESYFNSKYFTEGVKFNHWKGREDFDVVEQNIQWVKVE